MLTDADISTILETRRNIPNDQSLVINPYEERCLTPVGYDLRVGDQYQLLHEGVLHRINEGQSVKIPPGETANIRTLEWLAMPKDGSVAGLICSRVLLVAKGASHVSTTVDPDWVGNLLISITNHSRAEIVIDFGERLCTLVLFANKTKSHKLSQHAPGRPDALNENASRIASSHRRERRKQYALQYAIWLILGALYGGLVYWVHLRYGTNTLFVAMLAAGVIFSGLGLKVIEQLLGKK